MSVPGKPYLTPFLQLTCGHQSLLVTGLFWSPVSSGHRFILVTRSPISSGHWSLTITGLYWSLITSSHRSLLVTGLLWSPGLFWSPVFCGYWFILITKHFWSPISSSHRSLLVTGLFWSPVSCGHQSSGHRILLKISNVREPKATYIKLLAKYSTGARICPYPFA